MTEIWTDISLPDPITRIITLSAATNVAYLAALNAHFSRVDSTIGCQLVDGITLWMWPKADPLRWQVAYTTTDAAANGLTAYMDYGQDPTGVSLPADPTVWMTPLYSANPVNGRRTVALTAHVLDVLHTRFIVTEYGDAIFIMELLNPGETHFTKLYHFGETYAPGYNNAYEVGLRGLSIHGGTGAIISGTSANAFMSASTGNLASAVQVGGDWSRQIPYDYSSLNTSLTTLAIGGRSHAGLLSIKIAGGSTTSKSLGNMKYMKIWVETRAPGQITHDAPAAIAYTHINNGSATSGCMARVQYGSYGLTA